MNDFDKEIAEIYKDMELEMIKSMKRNLGLHIAEEAKTGLEYPQWQAIKIREMRKYQRQNKSLLKNSRRGMDKDIKDHIRDEMKQGSLHEMKRFKKAKGAGYKSAIAMKDSFFKINTKKVDSLINSVHSDFARADQAILRMMNDTYRSTIFKYGMYVSNGVYTEKQAYDAAVKDFLSRGLNCIEYKDGRRVNIADYTSMAIRTVNQRAYMAGEGEVRKQLGETLVIISKHATSCPLCQPFENKVLIDDVYSGGKADDGDYMLLSQAMAEGLFHPRCRHGLGTYYPELEDIVHYDTEENRVNDYGTDKINQAHIENMIQKYKRLTAGSIDPENIAKYQAKLDEWENKKAQLGVANSENSVIIKVSRYFNSSDKLYKFSKKVKPIFGYEDIAIHGDKLGFSINDSNGNEIESYSPKEFAAILKKDPNYHGGSIRLLSCETGADDACAAQWLANELNVDVLAPTDVLFIDYEGNLSIGPDEYTNTGTWKLFKPKGE